MKLESPNGSLLPGIIVVSEPPIKVRVSLSFGVGDVPPWTNLTLLLSCRPPLLLPARLGGRCCSSPWRKLSLKTATESGDTGSMRPEARPMLSTPPPSPPPRVGVEKEEEWDGMFAVLNDHVVDELMVVSTARRKGRWLSS